MATKQQTIRIEYSSQEDFQREYEKNISKGGVFAASRTDLNIREVVVVEIVLRYCRKRITLKGEVVHLVSDELAVTGATPGAAVHFHTPAAEISEKLQPFLGPGPEARDENIAKRRAQRSPARVPALLHTSDQGLIEGRCRDLSAVGALVSLYGEFVPTKQPLKLWVGDPCSNDEIEVSVRVMRQVKNDDGDITAIGVEFLTSNEEQEKVVRFVGAVCATARTRNLGAIEGPISQIGPEGVLRMFCNSAQQGTLTLIRGEEEGFIVFEKQLLCTARAGTLTGLDALAEMLSWTEGSFEFRARIEWNRCGDASVSIEDAILEALWIRDERARSESRIIPRDAILSVNGEAPASVREGLSKAEEAVVMLAEAGESVAKIISVIPESRSAINRVLSRLVDRGLIKIQE